jgi:LysM repeat protein
MSQMQPESTAPQAGGGNVFTRKLGPLPMWAWMGIALALAIVYYLYKKHTSSSTSSTSSAQNSSAAGGANSPGGVDASLVPQFVNQVYNQETPPVAPNVTVTNNIPADNDTQPPTGNAPPPPPSHSPPPGHPAPKPAPPKKVTYKTITVQPGQTLQSLAQQYHTTPDQIADVPGNVYVEGEVPGNKKVGQQLGSGAGLKTGQKIKIPITSLWKAYR